MSSSRKGRSSTRPGHRAAASKSRVRNLEDQRRALQRTVRALVSRVEKAVDEQGSAFSWFQAAANLEKTVRARTEELETVNARLRRELDWRREIELALKLAKLQAEAANQSKSRFVAAASHDLRQPLNSALLFLESIDEPVLDSRNGGFVRKTKLALSSLNNLLGTLLDAARLDSGTLTPEITDFSITSVLDRIVREYEDVARSAGVELRFIPSRAIVRTDIHLLETVLRNFISNAMRYTPQGRVLVGCRRRPHGVQICVFDTGIGIESSHLEVIFQAYYQVRSAHQPRDRGIGLGLSIVDRITQMLHLERSVKSVPGKGSMFAVQVPYGSAAARLDELSTHDGAAREPHATHEARSVVVIDDNLDVLQGMRSLLEKWGQRVITAQSAGDAIVKLIAEDLQPDFIICDYHLANGVKGDDAVTDVIRELDREPRVVIMTSDPDSTLRDRLRQLGFVVLHKPLPLAKLRALLARKSA
jgi:signal transduction histidine kinase/CheY-like chemotaxis protein